MADQAAHDMTESEAVVMLGDPHEFINESAFLAA